MSTSTFNPVVVNGQKVFWKGLTQGGKIQIFFSFQQQLAQQAQKEWLDSTMGFFDLIRGSWRGFIGVSWDEFQKNE